MKGMASLFIFKLYPYEILCHWNFLLFVLPLCCIAQVEYCDYSPKFLQQQFLKFNPINH